MSYNKVIYGGKTLIDLTGDTVTPEYLLKGMVAHSKDGTQIEGTLFADHPDEYVVFDVLTDSDGDVILDYEQASLQGRTVYKKA